MGSLSSRKQDIGFCTILFTRFFNDFFLCQESSAPFFFCQGSSIFLLCSNVLPRASAVRFCLADSFLRTSVQAHFFGLQIPERNGPVRLSFNCPQVHFDCFFIAAFPFFYSGYQVPHSAVTSFSLCVQSSAEVFFFFLVQVLVCQIRQWSALCRKHFWVLQSTGT